MSDSFDKRLAADREPERWRRLAQVFTDLARVARLREEGMTMDEIAVRVGWSRPTLQRWLAAAKLVERKGIRMTESSKQ